MVYTDIIIAVHGIGAQSRNATVRSVAAQLADSPTLYGSGQPGFAPQPLGYFHTDMHQAVKVSPSAQGGQVDIHYRQSLHGT